MAALRQSVEYAGYKLTPLVEGGGSPNLVPNHCASETVFIGVCPQRARR
jgi:hypothetical protein